MSHFTHPFHHSSQVRQQRVSSQDMDHVWEVSLTNFLALKSSTILQLLDDDNDCDNLMGGELWIEDRMDEGNWGRRWRIWKRTVWTCWHSWTYWCGSSRVDSLRGLFSPDPIPPGGPAYLNDVLHFHNGLLPFISSLNVHWHFQPQIHLHSYSHYSQKLWYVQFKSPSRPNPTFICHHTSTTYMNNLQPVERERILK